MTDLSTSLPRQGSQPVPHPPPHPPPPQAVPLLLRQSPSLSACSRLPGAGGEVEGGERVLESSLCAVSTLLPPGDTHSVLPLLGVPERTRGSRQGRAWSRVARVINIAVKKVSLPDDTSGERTAQDRGCHIPDPNFISHAGDSSAFPPFSCPAVLLAPEAEDPNRGRCLHVQKPIKAGTVSGTSVGPIGEARAGGKVHGHSLPPGGRGPGPVIMKRGCLGDGIERVQQIPLLQTVATCQSVTPPAVLPLKSFVPWMSELSRRAMVASWAARGADACEEARSTVHIKTGQRGSLGTMPVLPKPGPGLSVLCPPLLWIRRAPQHPLPLPVSS